MKKYLITFFICFSFLSTFSQEKFTISGYVTDANTGENIIGVNVFCKNLNLGVITNTYGYYSLTLPKGNHEVHYSFIGYTSQKNNIDLNKNIVAKILILNH